MLRSLIFILSLFLTLSFSNNTAFAAEEAQAPQLSAQGKQIKRNVTTVIFSSLAGGILGLSTLSFYGQPQEHTVNITTGVLIGFIGGLAAIFYNNYEQSETAQMATNIYQEQKIDFKNLKVAPIIFSYVWHF